MGAPRGSSPHARGAHPACDRPFPASGIIPACAGSTTFTPSARARTPDHPRMRGEHCRGVRGLRGAAGSSPHARGARLRGYRDIKGDRIIPACAGSTCAGRRRNMSCRDHPRMRGEHSLGNVVLSVETGSSPHARGARLRVGGVPRARGIIPACAGSTARTPGCAWSCRDHPRMRGEHGDVVGSTSDPGGSSPHARGARHVRLRHLRGGGIIPACAGSTT